ncbi:MAG: hypothetical protein ACOYL6_08295 [Bacteriovoracaceae bacterium]
MKTIISIFLILTSFSLWAESPCQLKVTGHYKQIYHKTYKAASNTFLNNFIGRKNLLAHTFGYPETAFLDLGILGQNHIAQGIVQKSKKSGEEVLRVYDQLLESEELCKDLGDDYSNPHKMKKYLLEKLKND